MNYLWCWLAFIVLFTTLVMAVENMEFSRALYFVIISSTTVGFGDVVCVSRAGKLVVMIGSLSSVLLFSALFANVAERLLVGRWHLIAMFLVVGVAVLCEVENASLEDMVWLLFQTITTVGSETKRKPFPILIPNKKTDTGTLLRKPKQGDSSFPFWH